MIRMFEAYIVPKLNEAFSKLLVLGDEYGTPLEANDSLLDASDTETNVVFKCSYATEWVNEIKVNGENQVSSFPFLFINTNGLTQEGSTYTVREMVLATQSDKEDKAEKKREKVVYPILFNLRDILIESMRDCFAVDEPFEPHTEVIYSEKERSKLPEGVDAIVFTNIKLRTIC